MSKPPKQNTHGSVMAASINAAASMLGVPPEVLKEAKRRGSAGFRANGSVCVSEVKEWLKANPINDEATSKKALECRKLIAQCEKLELDLEVARGNFIAIEEAKEDAIKAATAIRGEVLQFVNDLPSLVGLTAEEMHAKGLDWFNGALCESLSRSTRFA